MTAVAVGGCLLAGALQSPVHTATERCRKSFPGSPFLQKKKAAQSHCSVCMLSHTPLVYKVLYGWIFSPQGLCLCCLFPFDQPSCSLLNATFVPQVRGHLFPEVFPDLWPGLGLFLSVCLEKSFLTSPTATYRSGWCSHTRSSLSHGPAWLERRSASFGLVKICLFAALRREGFSNSETVCQGPATGRAPC